jgi:hypothetical protein
VNLHAGWAIPHQCHLATAVKLSRKEVLALQPLQFFEKTSVNLYHERRLQRAGYFGIL